MTINEGKLPPTLRGAFLVSPYELLSPTGPDDNYQKGAVIAAYKYQFYGQTDAGDIQFDFTNNGSDTGKGQGAFIAGNGSLFTIFAEASAVSSGIANKTVVVISGEQTTTGIRNFQYAFVVKEKTGDPNDNVLIGVDQGRIWIDGDKNSGPTTGFRLAAPTDGSTAATMSARR
ncbi:hypothetical protein GCM10027578_16870 [Spirosoma luteolum]